MWVRVISESSDVWAMLTLKHEWTTLLEIAYDPSIKVLENRELVSDGLERGEGVSS